MTPDTTETTETNEKPKRFMIRYFSDARDCEAFLNLLGDDYRVVGYADTDAYVSVCVERAKITTVGVEAKR